MNWIDHEEFDALVDNNWRHNEGRIEGRRGVEGFRANLRNMKEILIKWSKKEFPNNNKLIMALMSEFRD